MKKKNFHVSPEIFDLVENNECNSLNFNYKKVQNKIEMAKTVETICVVTGEREGVTISDNCISYEDDQDGAGIDHMYKYDYVMMGSERNIRSLMLREIIKFLQRKDVMVGFIDPFGIFPCFLDNIIQLALRSNEYIGFKRFDQHVVFEFGKNKMFAIYSPTLGSIKDLYCLYNRKKSPNKEAYRDILRISMISSVFITCIDISNSKMGLYSSFFVKKMKTRMDFIEKPREENDFFDEIINYESLPIEQENIFLLSKLDSIVRKTEDLSNLNNN